MIDNYFNAFIIKETDGKFIRTIEKKHITKLPANEVLIKVSYSSLNYKDALSSIGHRGVTKKYPHTPGIDAAGIVVSSKSKFYSAGDEVIVTGYDLGMNTPGGFAEYISVPADWIVKMPENLTMKESMLIGTAGFTAALSLYKLQQFGIRSSDDKILVTGASGSLGSLAVSILSKAGYKNIVAATGKIEKSDILKKLGAWQVVNRNNNDIDDKSNKPMLSGRWSGVIDSVGGNILSTAIKSAKYGGVIAACGLTQSFNFNATVYPFILRSVSLIGIDSAACPMETRSRIWNKLSGEWKINTLNYIYEEISLKELEKKINLMLVGKNAGRVIINLEK
ncbi:MAG: YhdH/YhfP family quinone oxidoreductase [Ignavibacteriaceae bacterium]